MLGATRARALHTAAWAPGGGGGDRGGATRNTVQACKERRGQCPACGFLGSSSSVVAVLFYYIPRGQLAKFRATCLHGPRRVRFPSPSHEPAVAHRQSLLRIAPRAHTFRFYHLASADITSSRAASLICWCFGSSEMRSLPHLRSRNVRGCESNQRNLFF